MTSKSQENGGWKPCPRGTLAHIAGRYRSRKLLGGVGRMALALAVAVGVGVFGAWLSGWRPGPSEYHFGGIACREVRANLPDYMAGHLAPEMAARIRVHLEECPNCQEVMRNMPGGVMVGLRHGEDCSCARCRRLFVPTVALSPPHDMLLP